MKAKKFVSPSVNAELKEAASWYNNARQGLGLLYLKEVGRLVNYITENPFAYSIRYSNIRVAFTNKFPYGIHYEYFAENNQVNILGIYHTSRNPDIWDQDTE